MVSAQTILSNVRWETTQAVSVAVIYLEDGKTRPLRQSEWESKLDAREWTDAGVWLMHPAAGLTKDKLVYGRCAHISANSTVKDILTAVAKMTVKRGPKRIYDRVFFEGVSMFGNFIKVNIGS